MLLLDGMVSAPGNFSACLLKQLLAESFTEASRCAIEREENRVAAVAPANVHINADIAGIYVDFDPTLVMFICLSLPPSLPQQTFPRSSLFRFNDLQYNLRTKHE